MTDATFAQRLEASRPQNGSKHDYLGSSGVKGGRGGKEEAAQAGNVMNTTFVQHQ